MRVEIADIAEAGLKGLTVGAVLRETLGTTLAFVSWYLREGADQIVICFDDPEDPAIAALDHRSDVLCLRCTPAFWQAMGVAPEARFPKRQNRAMGFVYRHVTDGWFLTVDGDELVRLEGRRLRDELDRTPKDQRSVTILPAETIQSPDAPVETHFRLAMSREAVHAVYGPHAGMMVKRAGLSGHTVGKTANRAGVKGMFMRQHFLQAPDGTKLMDRIIGPQEGATLMHFFDQGYEIWRAKLPWRLSSSGFTARAKAALQPVLEAPDPEPALREIYDALHVFDAERRALLADHGAHAVFDLDVEALMSATFPDHAGVGHGAVRYTG